jgi:hypothetical protein
LVLNIHLVVQFSKLTGDYSSLSVPDLKILALTWMLEKEHNGTEHLRSQPKKLEFIDVDKKPKPKPQNKETKIEIPENDGWITPDNIQAVTAKFLGQHLQLKSEVDHNKKTVGCITADFSMQVSNNLYLMN